MFKLSGSNGSLPSLLWFWWLLTALREGSEIPVPAVRVDLGASSLTHRLELRQMYSGAAPLLKTRRQICFCHVKLHMEKPGFILENTAVNVYVIRHHWSRWLSMGEGDDDGGQICIKEHWTLTTPRTGASVCYNLIFLSLSRYCAIFIVHRPLYHALAYQLHTFYRCFTGDFIASSLTFFCTVIQNIRMNTLSKTVKYMGRSLDYLWI